MTRYLDSLRLLHKQATLMGENERLRAENERLRQRAIELKRFGEVAVDLATALHRIAEDVDIKVDP